jgi:hypothetical protein
MGLDKHKPGRLLAVVNLRYADEADIKKRD